MFLGFVNTKTSNNYKLLSIHNLPILFYQLLPFSGEKCILPHFSENKQSSDPQSLCKVREIQL